MVKLMWLPDGVVDCDTITEKDLSFENLSNLCHTNRAWASNSDKFWPVTNHCYLTAIICSYMTKNGELTDDERQKAIIYSMFHDIEETFITDIPHPFKHKEIKILSDNIRDNILNNFLNIKYSDTTKHGLVKTIVNLCDILSLYWEVKNEGAEWINFSADNILGNRLKKCVNEVIMVGISPKSVLDTFVWLKLARKMKSEPSDYNEILKTVMDMII
jgi:hypothetical protein